MTNKPMMRRLFLQSLMASPLLMSGARALAQDGPGIWLNAPDQALNVFELRDLARQRIDPRAWAWLQTGSQDNAARDLNEAVFSELQLRVRRLIDVSQVDTSLEFLGVRMASPIMLAPVGVQSLFHPGAESETARGVARTGHAMMAGSMTSDPYETIAGIAPSPPWFQLYARWDRAVMRDLLARLDDAGCPIIALTVDTPIGGNREEGMRGLMQMLNSGNARFGNFIDDYTDPANPLNPLRPPNASLTWDDVAWLRSQSRAKFMIKGIVTHEDARIAAENGVDGLMVSNHGGRQEPSGRSALEALVDIVEAQGDRLPLIVDGGFRRGTDVFKALALGAKAVGIGRPQVWGLGAFGADGVETILTLLQAEFEAAMRFAGATRLSEIRRDHLAAPSGSRFDWLGLER